MSLFECARHKIIRNVSCIEFKQNGGGGLRDVRLQLLLINHAVVTSITGGKLSCHFYAVSSNNMEYLIRLCELQTAHHLTFLSVCLSICSSVCLCLSVYLSEY